MEDTALDVAEIRRYFDFPSRGRIVTNNAASTQPPHELIDLLADLTPGYENVHRGQSSASQATTARFEDAYDTVARFVNAPGRANIVMTRNTTEAHNSVMYSLMTEFRNGDNIVSTLMEHNSNHVPWYGLTTEILPRFGVKVEYRLARFDPATGELDLAHLASLVDTRTKLISVTGASNFLGSKPDLAAVRRIADGSGYPQPDGEPGSLLLVDGAQLVPSTAVDVQALDVDYLSFSFHKLLAPFGVGVLYAKQRHLERSLPFLYGGDMIAEGRVAEHHVEYNDLPWKYAAGTPNILGTILSAEALRLMLDLAIDPHRRRFFRTGRPITTQVVGDAMDRIGRHTRMLTARALDLLSDIEGITIYGPGDAGMRSPLVAFNVAGLDPFDIARRLDDAGVEARAGCHCATLAHRHLQLDPQASCRLSFSLYNTHEDVDVAVGAVADIVTRTRNGVRHSV